MDSVVKLFSSLNPISPTFKSVDYSTYLRTVTGNIYNNDPTYVPITDGFLSDEAILGPDQLYSSKLFDFFNRLVQHEFVITNSLKIYINEQLHAHYTKDPLLTLRIIFYRYFPYDRKESEKTLFLETYKWLIENHVEVAEKNVVLIIEWGGFTVLFQIYLQSWYLLNLPANKSLCNTIVNLLAQRLIMDRQILKEFQTNEDKLTLETLPQISELSIELISHNQGNRIEIEAIWRSVNITDFDNYQNLIVIPLQTHLEFVKELRADRYWKSILESPGLVGQYRNGICELAVKV